MISVSFLLRCVLLSSIPVVPITAHVIPANLPGKIQERNIRIQNLGATGKIAETTGGMVFPEEISATLEIDGWEAKTVQARRTKKQRLPVVEEIGFYETKKKKMVAPDTTFYTSSDGSFACQPKDNGINKNDCSLTGVVFGETENCFFKGKNNKAFCTPRRNGTDEWIQPANDHHPPDLDRRRKRDTSERQGRQKRQIVYPDSTARVINIAVVYDLPYMQRLATLNSGSYSLAIADAELMAVLITNEITYHYQTVKQYNRDLRGNLLDLACNLVLVRYPQEGTGDWSFVSLYFGALNYGPTLPGFGTWAYNQGITTDSGPAHHAMLVTGRDLYSPNSGFAVIGVAYVGSICYPPYYDARVSISEDLDFNLARVAAHEIGHALGASHDSSGNSCPAGRYLMSSYVFYPSAITKDSRYEFSSCSANYFESFFNHTDVTDCLDYLDQSFATNFCQGPRGQFDSGSLDAQCEAEFTSGYTTCNGVTKAPENGCWLTNSVSCKAPGSSNCINLEYVVDGTPCIGDDTTNDYYCYLGDCVLFEQICEGVDEETATTTTTPTTTTTTPTTTTTTPTTTTNTPTTTTTTPTTTTTTPTTTTTTPTTTTTTPTTTTTTPTTTTTTPTTTTTTPTTTTTTPTTTTPTTTTTTPTTTTPTTTTTTPTTTTTAQPTCPCPGFFALFCCFLGGIASCC